MSFQTTERFLGRLALGPLLGDVGASRRVDPGLGQDDDVKGGVQLAVAQAREAVAMGASRGDLDRRAAGVAGKGGV